MKTIHATDTLAATLDALAASPLLSLAVVVLAYAFCAFCLRSSR